MRNLSCLAALPLLLLAACAAPPAQAPGARLDHLALQVADARAAARFYQDAFGLVEVKSPFAGGGGVVWLDLGGGVALHLFSGRVQGVSSERERHIAISVPDMSRVIDFLARKGIAWQDFDGASGKVQVRPDGVQQMFFRDPDGYWIEVNDALKNSVR